MVFGHFAEFKLRDGFFVCKKQYILKHDRADRFINETSLNIVCGELFKK